MGMKVVEMLAVVAASVLLAAAGVAGDALDDRIQATEDVVRGLQQEATELFRNRKRVVTDCECTFHACGNRFGDDLVCTEVLGKSDFCEDCDVDGRLLDFSRSVVRTPRDTDPDNLSPEIIESICTFKPLDESFTEAGPKVNFTWTYIGSTTGVMRTWPGRGRQRDLEEGEGEKFLQSCRPYDPRIRPWYIAASSGPKDVVILLDTSGSMNMEIDVEDVMKTRWEVTKEAVQQLLGTFSIADFVGIVTFNSRAEVVGGEAQLLRANRTNIEMLREGLELIVPDEGTDFRMGFDIAFDMLINSTKLSAITDIAPTSDCQKVILFLTDGEDCTLNDRQFCPFDLLERQSRSLNGPDLVLELIEEKQKELEELDQKPANIFTFSMTSDADDKIPKIISCENDGSWEPIEERDDPLAKFLDYTRFLAWGRRGFDVIWSSFYVDDGGLGNMTTAAMPVFAPDTADGIPGLLVGVVGHDVLVEQLEQDDKNFKQVFDRIIDRTSTCRAGDLSPCQLQVLRGEQAECPERFPKSPCYFFEEEEHLYIADTEKKLTFEEAEEECKALGGNLAEINSVEEHRFLSGLSTRDGSWIGLRLDTSNFQLTWRWLTSDDKVEAPHKSFNDDDDEEEEEGQEDEDESENGKEYDNLWAKRAKEEEDCAAIDRRGVERNIADVDCEREMTYICEFELDNAPKQCRGNKILRVDRRYDPTVPAIEDCTDFEIALAASTEVVEETKKLDSKTAVCKLGKQKRTTEEVTCCCSDIGCIEKDGVRCDKEYISP